jgi:hypothetical protein
MACGGMWRWIVALADKQVNAVKPGTKAFRPAEGGGLTVLVTPAGGKVWRVKRRFGAKEKQLALGPSARRKRVKLAMCAVGCCAPRS